LYSWQLTLREKHRLRKFENRKIFGDNRFKVAGEWRRLHNEEINDLYSSPNVIRLNNSTRMRRGRACCTYGR